MSGGGKERLAIFPTRMALTTMKNRLKGAQKGHSLLKKKADALSLRFRSLLKRIVEVCMLMHVFLLSIHEWAQARAGMCFLL